jgi:hypothetical protein
LIARDVIANTKSMFPTLDDNCLVILEPTDTQTIFNKNDIVLFGENILHRIENVDGDIVFIRGDNTTHPDGFIKKSSIRYRVVIILYYSK